MSQAADPTSLPPLPKDHLDHPEQWATGSDPATSKQKGFIKVLEKQHPDAAPEGGIDVEGMQKGEASEVIEKLKNGQAVDPAPAQNGKEEKVEGLLEDIQGIVDEDSGEKKEAANGKDKDTSDKPTESPAKPSSQTLSQNGRRITSDSNSHQPTGDPSASFSDIVSQHENKKADAAAPLPSSSQAPQASSQVEQVDFSGIDKKPTKQTTLDAHVGLEGQNGLGSKEGVENGHQENGHQESGQAENGHTENEVAQNGQNGHKPEDKENGAEIEAPTDEGSRSARKRKDDEAAAAEEEGGVAKKAKVVGKGVKDAIDEIVADSKEW